ncbi:MAG TPA: GNAT family protein [Verrucomicrobiae bacterium]|jgi:ribosomal-protein-serine acetyltransferase|nr:GNAT family protein [Verrucomicrobiae bacterium]
MLCQTVNEETELRLIDREHSKELFGLFEVNREHLRRWHPWVDMMNSAAVVEKSIATWQQQYSSKQGYHAGIWFKQQFCGMISYLNVDCSNRWTALFYWLDAAHQGQGIMTSCCRTMIDHGFDAWKLNRITIECATDNSRSRAIPERLGFRLEGIVRGIEWLHDHYVDHAMYGLLRSDYRKNCSPSPLLATAPVARGSHSFRPG